MTKSESRPLNVVILATFFKGVDFMRELKSHGCRVFVVTKERFLEEDWPRECIEELFALPNDAVSEIFFDVIRHISKENRIDRVVALEEFDVTLTFCFTPESSGIRPHHTSPPRSVDEFADFCARMTRRYTC